MSFVIRYADGAFNDGPEGTAKNGFPVDFVEASRYSTLAAAEEKALDLRHPDGSGVEIIDLRHGSDASGLAPAHVRFGVKVGQVYEPVSGAKTRLVVRDVTSHAATSAVVVFDEQLGAERNIDAFTLSQVRFRLKAQPNN